MKALGEIINQVVSDAAERKRLREAHDHAERFHAAMSRAMDCQDDIEDYARDLRDPRYAESHEQILVDKRRTESAYKQALGEAADAYGKMPVLWAMVTEQML